MTRPFVIVESPYAAPNVEAFNRHLSYLRRALRDSWERGELPFASHGFFPFFLHETDPQERKAGIEAGYSFWEFLAPSNPLEQIAFYTDLGMSPGMQLALDRCGKLDIRFTIRNIGTEG